MAYNTGNPLGSSDFKDLSDNAVNFDKYSNGPDPTYPNRLGQLKLSIEGMNQEFNNAQDGRDAEFQQFLDASAYIFIGDYGAGLNFTNRSQYMIRDGVPYRIAEATTLPYTTTGNWALEAVNFSPIATDQVLRQDLGVPSNNITAWERRVLNTSIDSANKMLDAQSVNIWEYADLVTVKPTPSDPSTWDWTPAINAACVGQTDIFPTVGDVHVYFPQGTYRMTSVDIGRRVHIYCAGAVFTPFDPSETRSHLVRFIGFNVSHDLTIQMEYSLTYDTAVWVRGRYIDLNNTNIWSCKCGWVVGDPAWETDAASGHLGDSEINISGGATVWAVTGIRLYGQNTIVHVTGGARLYSSKNSIPLDHPNRTAWLALPDNTVVACGGLLYVTGSGMANFSGTVPMILSKLQIVDSIANPAYTNAFGKVFLNGVHLETGFIFKCAPVPVGYTAGDTTSRVFQMHGCNGYLTGSANNCLDIGNDCIQSVHVSGCGFYGVTNNNVAFALQSPVYVEPGNFQNISIDTMQTLKLRRPQGYSTFCAANVTSSVQAVTTSFANLVFPTRAVSDLMTAFEPEWYSTSTGVFTNKSPMRDVRVEISLVFTGGVAGDVTNFNLVVNGSTVDSASVTGANPRVSLRSIRIPQSATVSIQVSHSVGRSLSGTASNNMMLTGSL